MLEYLSHINTTQTLQILVHSYYDKTGERDRLIYENGDKKTRLSSNEAMEVLSRFRETAPELLKKNEREIRALLERTFEFTKKDPERYIYDFYARYYALDVLEFYANPKDISYMQKIVDDAWVTKKDTDDDRCPPGTLKAKLQGILEGKPFKVKK